MDFAPRLLIDATGNLDLDLLCMPSIDSARRNTKASKGRVHIYSCS